MSVIGQITGGPGTGMVVRTAVEAASITPAVRQAIWSADPNQPVARIETFEEIIAARCPRPRKAPRCQPRSRCMPFVRNEQGCRRARI